MNELRILILATFLAFGAGAEGAQTAPAPPDEAGKAQSTAPAPKKVGPQKSVKKATAKKPARRPAAPPAAAQKKIVAPKGETILHAPATITTGPAVLRDRDGNIIPTQPEAYNVESATGKQPPRR